MLIGCRRRQATAMMEGSLHLQLWLRLTRTMATSALSSTCHRILKTAIAKLFPHRPSGPKSQTLSVATSMIALKMKRNWRCSSYDAGDSTCPCNKSCYVYSLFEACVSTETMICISPTDTLHGFAELALNHSE